MQDNQAVESRNLLDKSDGQPSKPTFTVREDAIAAPYYPSGGEPALVHADGDNPLVKQETMSQLNCEKSMTSQGEERCSAISLDQSGHCLNPSINVVTSKSQRFVGCSIVGCEHQVSRAEERRVRLRDCEHYLRQDSRFWYVTEQVGFFPPGPKWSKIIHEFRATAYWSCYRSEVDLIRERGRVLSEYIARLDEEYDRC
jgi:hypothetical protein